ncbi:MAG: energy transducer TonB [Gemmatimonadetes bacterium]|nr:energy transducer TonB [Gemmatimonadota bacterium]
MHWLLLVVGALMIVGGIAGVSEARRGFRDRVSNAPLLSRFAFSTTFASEATLRQISRSRRMSWAGLVVALAGVVMWVLSSDEPARTGAAREAGDRDGKPGLEVLLEEVEPPPPPPPPLLETAASGTPEPEAPQDPVLIPEVMPSISNPERVKEVLAHSYPDALRGSGIEGKVWVRGVVDTSGRLVQPTVLRGLDPLLDRAAIEALSAFEFVPGRMGGAAAPVWMTIVIEFRSGIGMLVGGGSNWDTPLP